MATCPNVNLDSWKQLVAAQGEAMAYYLWDKYNEDVPSSYLQITSDKQSIASESLIDRIKDVAKSMGVSITTLADYAKSTGLPVKDVNGVADLMRKVIAIAEGKEKYALVEEVIHIASAMIEQVNPKMITEMISKIDRFKIYKEVYEKYKNNPNYQLSDGRPDIRKIKKEAVDKLLSEVLINQEDNTQQYPELLERENLSMIHRWWNSILDFIRGQYRKSDISLFQEGASAILTQDYSGIELEDNDSYYQLVSPEQESIQKKILDTRSRIDKVHSDEKTDPILQDTEEANNWYEIDGRRILRRVTDRVKAWYKDRFPNRKFSDIEKKFNELKRNYGIAGHKDLEEIHNRYFNSDGTRKTNPDEAPNPDSINLESYGMYEELETYYLKLVNSFPEDTLIFSEVIVYDQKNDEAGTIDFLAVEKSGKGHILDWKFMYIRDKSDDVAWFKQGAFGIQLSRYRSMLKEDYGINSFGMVRAIPISMEFKRKEKKNPDSDLVLKSIAIGDLDASKIDIDDELYLLPVSEEKESTGNEDLDEVIEQLNILYKSVESESVPEEELSFRKERLKLISKAIRVTQTSGKMDELVRVIRNIKNNGDRIIEEYKAIYKNKNAFDEAFTDKQLSEFSEDLRRFINTADKFSGVAQKIGHLIYTEDMEAEAKTPAQKKDLAERKKLLKDLQVASAEIARTRTEAKKSLFEFGDRFIGWRNLVYGLLKPQAIIKGLGAYFNRASEFGLKTVEILSKVVQSAETKAEKEGMKFVERLFEIRKSLMEEGDVISKIQKIYRTDTKGNTVNELVYMYDKEFFEAVDKNANDPEGGSKDWLYDNIDVEKYKEAAAKRLENNIKAIERNHPGNDEDIVKFRNIQILKERQKWDIDRIDFNGFDNYLIKNFPLEKWESKEYQEIKQDSKLLELYNFIQELNTIASGEGYISNMVRKTFLPFVAKTTAEALAFDGITSAIGNFQDSIERIKDAFKITEKDMGYSTSADAMDAAIPKYFTKDFTKTSYDQPTDMTQVSQDIFANLLLYIQHLHKYKYLNEVAGQMKVLKTIEEFKGHLDTDFLGNVIKKENGEPRIISSENVENTESFIAFYKALVLKQKYPLSPSDVAIGIHPINSMKKFVNKVAGTNFEVEENPDPYSVVKSMEQTNFLYRLKALGLDPISGLANLFGSNIQISAIAGKYFKSREFLSSEVDILNNIYKTTDDTEMFTQLVNTFLPMKDSPFRELYKEAGISRLTRGNIGDTLMVFMRKPEEFVEKAVFLTLLKNSMIVDGNIVNITEYVKSKYEGRSNSSADYRAAKKSIDNEIDELKKNNSLWVTKKLEDGKLVIPGFNLDNSREVERLSKLSKDISRRITGTLSNEDINKAGMNIIVRSMMVFQNWIPPLLQVRFSEFKRINDDFSVVINPETGEISGERYDVGRVRLLINVIGGNILNSVSRINDVISVTDNGVKIIDELYSRYVKEYETKTGEKVNMTKDEFTDMVVNNLRNQIKELGMLLTIFGILFSSAFGLIAPDDDDDKATKNMKRYTERILNKFADELSFFYNPVEIERILSGDKLPALGLFNDVLSTTKQVVLETTGEDFDPKTSPEKVRKQAQPIKYVLKLVPGGKIIVNSGAIFSNEFAKDFDITIQAQNTMR